MLSSGLDRRVLDPYEYWFFTLFNGSTNVPTLCLPRAHISLDVVQAFFSKRLILKMPSLHFPAMQVLSSCFSFVQSFFIFLYLKHPLFLSHLLYPFFKLFACFTSSTLAKFWLHRNAPSLLRVFQQPKICTTRKNSPSICARFARQARGQSLQTQSFCSVRYRPYSYRESHFGNAL